MKLRRVRGLLRAWRPPLGAALLLLLACAPEGTGRGATYRLVEPIAADSVACGRPYAGTLAMDDAAWTRVDSITSDCGPRRASAGLARTRRGRFAERGDTLVFWDDRPSSGAPGPADSSGTAAARGVRRGDTVVVWGPGFDGGEWRYVRRAGGR